MSPRQAARSGPAKPSPPVAAARGEGTVLLPLLPRHSGARLGLVRVGPVFRVGLGVGLGLRLGLGLGLGLGSGLGLGLGLGPEPDQGCG